MKKCPVYHCTQTISSLFENSQTLDSLSKHGNPLEFISGIVDFDIFRPVLEARLQTQERKSNAGRRPIDPVLMFKVMFLQRLYGLSDEQTEYQIKDRTSFRNFIGIVTVDDVPDARTIWKYREELTHSGAYDELFRLFHEHLQGLGLTVNEGKITDAGFVVVPRQRNTREENKAIKNGEGDSLRNDHPHKKCHKDIVWASAVVAMTNLTYNIARPAQIFKYHRDRIIA